MQSHPSDTTYISQKGVLLAGSLLASGGLVGSYSSFIETKWYDMTRITLSFERLPNSFHGLKLLQFSDLHIGHHFNLKDLERVVTLINKEKADLLTFTGIYSMPGLRKTRR